MESENLIIIGSGPSGYSAAIYSARARLYPVLFQGVLSGVQGGQLMTTTEIENFPGFPEGIFGPDLMDKMQKQGLRFGTTFLSEDVLSVDFSTHPFVIQGSKTTYVANAVIVATGAEAKKLDIPGVKEFWQKGVSVCAVCDGAVPIFRGKDLFVVGGGDTAMEEALVLTKYAKKVFIVHRRDQFRASKIMEEKVKSHPKIEVLWNREMIAIQGSKNVERVVLKDVLTGKQEERDSSGVFFAIGYRPNVEFLKGQLELEESGYIRVKKGSTKTSKEGVFAAGDVQDSVYRQAIVAAASGCMAALDAEKWLLEKGFLS